MCDSCGEAACKGCPPYPNKKMNEHDTLRSRTTGRKIEISMGPQSGGRVPKNPFASELQAKFAHANPAKFGGKKGLEEWDKSTNFKNLPKKVKK
jgi:hypothetical protein